MALLIQAGSTMGLDVPAHGPGHTMVKADVTQVVDRHVGEEGEHSGERGERIADERETQIVVMRPSLVLGQLFHDGGGQTFAGEHLEQVAFGQVRVIEGGANQLQVGAEKEAGGKTSGAAPGERDFSPARHALQLLEDGFFRDHLDVGGDSRSLRHAQQVEEIEEFHQGQRNQTRRLGMPHQGELDGVAAPDLLVVGKFANDLVRQVFALEQAEQIALLQMGIARQPHKHLFRGFFEEALNFRA